MNGISVMSIPIASLKNPNMICEVDDVKCLILAVRNFAQPEPLWYDCVELRRTKSENFTPGTHPLSYRLSPYHCGFFEPGKIYIFFR